MINYGMQIYGVCKYFVGKMGIMGIMGILELKGTKKALRN
jgi:hypothetical protein